MAHVGSPDTFFAGKAGPYDVRVSVRLPGVIPGRAQVTVRLPASSSATDFRVSVRAGQWNVGLQGAPPPEPAVPVPGDPTLHAAEIWFMTASSYQMAVDVEGPSGSGHGDCARDGAGHGRAALAALARLGARRRWALLLTAGLLTLIATGVRESVLPPGEEPDASAASPRAMGRGRRDRGRGPDPVGREHLVGGRGRKLSHASCAIVRSPRPRR